MRHRFSWMTPDERLAWLFAVLTVVATVVVVIVATIVSNAQPAVPTTYPRHPVAPAEGMSIWPAVLSVVFGAIILGFGAAYTRAWRNHLRIRTIIAWSTATAGLLLVVVALAAVFFATS